MRQYIAIVHKDSGSDYGVSFPDFPGCITAGSTLDEAREMAQEALEAHTAYMVEEDQELPEPMSMEAAIQATLNDNRAGFLATMVIPLDESENDNTVERINITVQVRDLVKIDRYRKTQGLSRSAFLIQAARKVMPSTGRSVKR